MGENPLTIEDIPIVNEPTRAQLNDRQLVDYEEYKASLVRWLLRCGKDPEKVEGYAWSTVRQVAQKADKFYRWVWDDHEGYTTKVGADDAERYITSLLYDENEYSAGHMASTQKCLQRLFKWRRHELGETGEWDPDHTFTQSLSQPRDYLTVEERKQIREAALEYGSIPAYTGLTPVERDEWKTHLAQRFGKPKAEIGPDDWDRANGWKIPSLVWTSLDTGLRPIEVGRATIEWVDVENGVLRIPKDESSKNRENWIVGVTDRTATALERWLNERAHYDPYHSSDALWLTREGNPYTSHSLIYVLERLCEIAEIPTENRQMSWYTIRHSVGTYMTREEDLAAAQTQLRHKSPKTTMRYDQTPVEDRRDALNRMG
ncbi:tyrosine-type recombinase/integrase [Natrinema sp. H-ect4]|uniref:tyrosine-type recombinase/integrase n=1 Tax=Natrinema sp. H-ect4 TaxID=3242699 RepID=UPI0035A8276E